MDGVEGQAWLEWWANPSTLLGRVGITVAVEESDVGLVGRGRLVDDADVAAFASLYELDSTFTLRLAAGDAITVTVHPETARSFALTSEDL